MGTKWCSLFLLIICFMFIMPTQSSAHSNLVSASPAPNSILQLAPKEIRLEFNERLQKELFAIKVYDDKGNLISKNNTVMSTNQRVITLPLPKLKSGVYTITYHIISADGHAVKSSYVLTLGQPSDPPQPIVKGHTHSDPIAIYSFRIVHYLFFLALTGWFFWKPFLKFTGEPEELEYRKWMRLLSHLNLFFLIQTILLQSVDSLDDISYTNIVALWMNTTLGFSWLSMLFLSLLAYWAANQVWWKSSIWLALMLFMQTFSGHAMAAEQPAFTLFLDWIHLLGAAIWIGGLLFITLFLKNYQALVLRFLPVFSRAAFICILVLIVSGTSYTLILLPKIEYIMYTDWGLFLLAKLILVMAVIFIGSRIRHAMKQANRSVILAWIKKDFILMLGILSIVGIFTYLSPLPSNNPLDWRFTQGNEQRNVSITPNTPGNNQFTVYLTQDKKKAGFKSVAMVLIPMDHPEIAPIEISLRLLNQSVSSANAEDNQFTYSVDGPFLAFPGKWRLKLIVVDAKDNEILNDKVMRIY